MAVEAIVVQVLLGTHEANQTFHRLFVIDFIDMRNHAPVHGQAHRRHPGAATFRQTLVSFDRLLSFYIIVQPFRFKYIGSQVGDEGRFMLLQVFHQLCDMRYVRFFRTAPRTSFESTMREGQAHAEVHILPDFLVGIWFERQERLPSQTSREITNTLQITILFGLP